MRCPRCGNEINDNASFCIHCGGKVVAQKEKANKANAPSKGKSNAAVVVVLICLIGVLFIGVGIGGTLLFTNVFKTVGKMTENPASVSSQVSEAENMMESESIANNTENSTQIEEDVSSMEVALLASSIDEKYNKAISDAYNEVYRMDVLGDGFIAYTYNGELKLLEIGSEYSGSIYYCYYYFEGFKLVYSCYEGGDVNYNFYFDKEKLIRWSKEERGEAVVNHDMEDTADFFQWESMVLQSAYDFCDTWEERGSVAGDYILPESNIRLITRAELDALSKEEIKIARNEIYARHGRKFKDATLQAHFMQCSWYVPLYEPAEFDESVLSSIEEKNRDFIVEYEKEKGYR